MPLKEIRIHGRGGQGAVTSSQVLAIAAFHDGRQSQAFPMFGVERTGAPVQSFVRISSQPINVRQQVYEPDYVIVLDSTLVGLPDVEQGISKGSVIIVNSDRKPAELGLKKAGRVYTINITKIALETIGKPFVNLAALGAFAAITGEVSLKALEKAVSEKMEGKGSIAELNIKALQKVFEEAKKLK